MTNNQPTPEEINKKAQISFYYINDIINNTQNNWEEDHLLNIEQIVEHQQATIEKQREALENKAILKRENRNLRNQLNNLGERFSLIEDRAIDYSKQERAIELLKTCKKYLSNTKRIEWANDFTEEPPYFLEDIKSFLKS